MAAIMDFTYNAMSQIFFLAIPLCRAYQKTHCRQQNHESATILEKIISIYCFTLNIWRPSWISPTMKCPIVRSGHTTMFGVAENPMVDTKITNLLLFYRKLYQFIV